MSGHRTRILLPSGNAAETSKQVSMAASEHPGSGLATLLIAVTGCLAKKFNEGFIPTHCRRVQSIILWGGFGVRQLVVVRKQRDEWQHSTHCLSFPVLFHRLPAQELVLSTFGVALPFAAKCP